MRLLLILVACLAAGYGGYWFVGRGAATAAVTAGLERLEARGLEVEYTGLETVGFPSRFDTTITGLRLADPARGMAWEAPFFQLFAVSTQPNHIIAVWPDSQRLTLAGMPMTLVTESLRASARARPTPALPLTEATLEGRALALTGDAGWTLDVAATLLALRAVTGDTVPEASYEVLAEATDIVLPRQLLTGLGSAAPGLAERMRIEGRVVLDRPLDRFAVETTPFVTAFDLRDMTLRWGDLSVSGVGSLTFDGMGVPEGQVTLTVTNWQRLIDMGLAAGALTDRQSRNLVRAATALSDGTGQLTAPIRFQNGFMSLGPLPIGPAPRLR